jgi:hypothetical protein
VFDDFFYSTTVKFDRLGCFYSINNQWKNKIGWTSKLEVSCTLGFVVSFVYRMCWLFFEACTSALQGFQLIIFAFSAAKCLKGGAIWEMGIADGCFLYFISMLTFLGVYCVLVLAWNDAFHLALAKSPNTNVQIGAVLVIKLLYFSLSTQSSVGYD